MFIFQSCQSDSDELISQKESNSSFLASLKQSQNDINSITFNNKGQKGAGNMSREIQQATETICLQFSDEFLNENGELDVQEIVDQVETVTELIQIKQQYGLQIIEQYIDNDVGNDEEETGGETTEPEQECLATFEIPIQPVVDALEPTIEEAKNYLNSKGYDNSDIAEIMDGDEDESSLIPLVIGMIEVENEQNYATSIDFNLLFGNSMYAQSWGDIVGCAIAATGLDVFDDLRGLSEAGGKSARKKILKKAFKKIATKFMGPIGVAITVAEFAVCVALVS